MTDVYVTCLVKDFRISYDREMFIIQIGKCSIYQLPAANRNDDRNTPFVAPMGMYHTPFRG